MTTAPKIPREGGGAVLFGGHADRLLVRGCIPRAMLAWLLEPGRDDDDVVASDCDTIRVEVSGHADDATAKRVASETIDKLKLALTRTEGAA